MITQKQLFEDIRSLCESGWHDLPDTGTGAPGDYLEHILGLKTTNHDGPDAGLWELKFTQGTSLLTLFHKTPRPKGSMKYIVNKHGWIGKNGKQSFRHTITGESPRGFTIALDSGCLWFRGTDAMDTTVHWTEDDLLNAAGAKLRRLVLVEGEKKNGKVRYTKATAFEQFKLSKFMKAVESGLISVDFDAYIKPSGAVRDHGTKFRVHPENLARLYDKKRRL